MLLSFWTNSINMVLPMEFLVAFTGFFEIKNVIFCHEESFNTDSVEVERMLGALQHFYTASAQEKNISDFLNNVDNKVLFVCPFHDIQTEEEHFLPHVYWLTEFQEISEASVLPLRLDSNFVSYTESQDKLELTEWFKVKGGNILSTPLGLWSFRAGLTVPLPMKWERRGDFGGASFVNGIILGDWPPICMVNQKQDGTVEIWGLLPDVMDVLKAKLNFTVQHVIVEDNEYGRLAPTGVWTGIVKELEEKRADLTFAGLTITHDRSQVAGYTIGVFTNTVTILVRDPKVFGFKDRLNFFAFITVFSLALWICVSLFLFAMSLFLGLLPWKPPFDNNKLSFQRGFAASFLALLQLGMDSLSSENIEAKANRIAFFTLSMGCLFLFIGYNADLTSFLTATAPAVKLSTFKVKFGISSLHQTLMFLF